tara:strand:+ start:280 stop:1431 length:1152 start_codon:yes stop_codon:yes gene_type:complete
MNLKNARQIIKENNLVTKKISKNIINYIIGRNDKIDNEALSFASKNELDVFKKRINEIKAKLGNYKPRNLPVYLLIKEKNKNFNWSKINKHFDIQIDTSSLGIRVSLASLLLSKKIKSENHEIRHKVKSFFNAINVVDSDEENFELFSSLFQKGLKGEELNIISPICPDYSVKRIMPGLYEFTFKRLNSNVGVIGKRILKNLNKIHSFFKENRIKFTHTIAIGDFECLSEENLNRMKCNKREFLIKLKKSQKKLKKSTKLKITTPFFTDICGGIKNWSKFYKINLKALKNHKYNQSKLNHSKILDIGYSRKELYKKWFENVDQKKIEEIIYKQGAEYATMGQIVQKKKKNSIILGADHAKMKPFYKINSNIPVIYIKSGYLNN